MKKAKGKTKDYFVYDTFSQRVVWKPMALEEIEQRKQEKNCLKEYQWRTKSISFAYNNKKYLTYGKTYATIKMTYLRVYKRYEEIQ